MAPCDERGDVAPCGSWRAFWGATLLLVTLAFLLNLWHNDFPPGYHLDEAKKIRFVTEGKQDFKHPILMLQVNRLARRLLRAETPPEILQLGRGVNAAAGALTVLVTAAAARALGLRRRYALAGVAAVAVSPMLVMHAHYFKEGTIAVLTIWLALYLLLRFMDRPNPWRILLAAVGLGLAISAQYMGALVALPLLTLPLADARFRTWRHAALVAVALLLAGLVFLGVNHPLFREFGRFRMGLQYSFSQAMKGNAPHIRFSPWASRFAFHLTRSLWPGLTPLPLLLAVMAVGTALAAWHRTPPSRRMLALFCVVFYLAVEWSPLKVFPDHMRYTLPLAPVLLLLAYDGLDRLDRAVNLRVFSRGAAVVTLLSVATPAYVTARVLEQIPSDARLEADRWRMESKTQVIDESYSSARFRRLVSSLAEVDVEAARKQGFTHLIASSFKYEQYLYAAGRNDAEDWVKGYAERYRTLFRYPYRELRPRYRSFALNNPTLRIIDISQPLAEPAKEDRPQARKP